MNVEIVPNPKGSKWPLKLLAILKEELKKILIMLKEGIKDKEKEKITKKVQELLTKGGPFIIRFFWKF